MLCIINHCLFGVKLQLHYVTLVAARLTALPLLVVPSIIELKPHHLHYPTTKQLDTATYPTCSAHGIAHERLEQRKASLRHILYTGTSPHRSCLRLHTPIRR